MLSVEKLIFFSLFSLACAYLYHKKIRGHSRRDFLIVFSMLSIGYFDAVSAGFVFIYASIVFLISIKIERDRGKNKSALLLSIFSVLAVFLLFKLLGNHNSESESSLFSGVIIPLGFSYLTCKSIHYLIEVHRGSVPRQGYRDLYLYLVFFPSFSAGPIQRLDDYISCDQPQVNVDAIVDSLSRVLLGLFKKIVIAEFLLAGILSAGLLTSDLLETKQSYMALEVWWALILFYLYCFFDFSALADIAIGMGGLFGKRLPENFNYPLLARDPGDFWRRWHMTLSEFCRHYIFLYALSSSRRYIVAFPVTMVIMGLWHDITFNWLMWGVYHGLGLYLFLKTRPLLASVSWPKVVVNLLIPIRVVLTFLYVALGYAWAGTDNFSDGLTVFFAALGLTIGAP